MDQNDILTVSLAVVTAVQLVKWMGLNAENFGPKMPPVVITVSSVIVLSLWGYDHHLRGLGVLYPFDFLQGLLLVMMAAAGVFGFTRQAGEIITSFRNK